MGLRHPVVISRDGNLKTKKPRMYEMMFSDGVLFLMGTVQGGEDS